MEDILLSSQVHAVCIVAETLQQRSVRRKCELRLKEKPCLRGGQDFRGSFCILRGTFPNLNPGPAMFHMVTMLDQ